MPVKYRTSRRGGPGRRETTCRRPRGFRHCGRSLLQLAAALVAAALLQGCRARTALVLIDPVLESLSRETAGAYASFSPPGCSREVLRVPAAGSDAFVREALERIRPDIVMATPLLEADLRQAAAAIGGILPASLSSSPPDDPGEMITAVFDSALAYRALGRTFGRVVGEYNKTHPDRSYCGILFAGNPNRPESWLAAFQEGFSREGPADSLALRILPAGSPPEAYERAISDLETYNLAALLVSPPGSFGRYRQRFPNVLFIEDPGDFYYPPAPEPASPAAALVLVRDPRLAVRALERALGRGERGLVPVPVSLRREKGGIRYLVEGKPVEELFREACGSPP